MAFYGTCDAETQTEVSNPELFCQEGDNTVWRLAYDDESAFVSLDKVLGHKYSSLGKPEPDLTPGGMSHVDLLLSENDWYR